jgi:hypothetical protein
MGNQLPALTFTVISYSLTALVGVADSSIRVFAMLLSLAAVASALAKYLRNSYSHHSLAKAALS